MSYVATQHPTHMHGNLPNSGVSGEQGENYNNCRQGSGVWRAGSQRYGGRGGQHAEWETTRRWAQSRGRLQEFLRQYPKAGCPYPKGSIMFGCRSGVLLASVSCIHGKKHACTHACACTDIHTHIYACARFCTLVHAPVYVNICVHICI